jgi:uncharacterized membrane protein
MGVDQQRSPNYGPLIAASTLLGIGLGGFLDGILLHQLLQVHNMMSAVRPRTTIVNMEINMFWDGLFHAFTWLMTAIGLGMLWGAVRRTDVPLSTKAFIGSLVMGWGIFNVVEGIIDHHILNIHHVVERLGVSMYDWAFLGISVLMILCGWSQIRSAIAAPQAVPAGQPPRQRGSVG